MEIGLTSPNSEDTSMYSALARKFSNANGTVLTIITVILILFFIMARYLGISADPLAIVGSPTPKSTGIYIIEVIMWALLVFLILINGLQYLFNLDIKASLHDIFTEPKIDLTIKGDKEVSDIPQIETTKQVFHVKGNDYTYDDAKALCTAYGARLANQHEIDEAYRGGAEWCSYGWSEDQLALFPTQESTWFRLKKSKGHENDCGRPGINGGYIDNPKIKFGANCFGYKPEISGKDRTNMTSITALPLTTEERAFNEKVGAYRKKIDDTVISPFNKNRWSHV